MHLRQANQESELQLQVYSIAKLIRVRIRDARKEYFLAPILATKQLAEYLLLCIGLFFMLRNRQFAFATLIALTILYFVGLQGIYGNARFKIPIIPLYLIVSARGLEGLLSMLRGKMGYPGIH